MANKPEQSIILDDVSRTWASKPEKSIPDDVSRTMANKPEQSIILDDVSRTWASKPEKSIPDDVSRTMANKPEQSIILDDVSRTLASKPEKSIPDDVSRTMANKPEQSIILDDVSRTLASKQEKSILDYVSRQCASKPEPSIMPETPSRPWTIDIPSNLVPNAWVRDGSIHARFRAFIAKLFHILKSQKVKRKIKLLFLSLLIAIYFVFFTAILVIPSQREKHNYWCEADGLFIILTSLVAIGVFYFKIFKVYMSEDIYRKIEPLASKCEKYTRNRRFQALLYCSAIASFIIFLIVDSADDRSRLMSGLGVLLLLAIGTAFSRHPYQINFRLVIWGIMIQILFGLSILRWHVGKAVFQCLGDKVTTFLSFTNEGTSFTFGGLVTEIKSYVFAVLTMILFFGMLVSVLYYYGILQWAIMKMGWLLETTMGTTPCESMAAAANIFLGMSEAPLVIKPYLTMLTNSELHAVITCGFATVAGTIFGAYISFGVDAAHLLTASVMSAPAALAMAKLFYPETEDSQTTSNVITIIKGEEKSVLHAIINGLISALPLIANITACLIGFIALTAFLNSVFDLGCQLLDYEEKTCEFQAFIGYILIPIAWAMGIPNEDCYKVGYMLGTKFFVTEFIAYRRLTDMFKKGMISPRSVVITTYALCGFSNIASMGCVIGVFGCLAPSRTKDVAKVAFRAVIAGNFACYLTACVAGTLIQDSPLIPFPFTEAGIRNNSILG